MTKQRSDALAEKISAEQKAQLIDWLSHHSYADTCALVAAPPPDGFGFETSRAALSRFYKAHFEEITKRRQEKLLDCALEQLHYEVGQPEYREVLADSVHLSLQERFCEALNQPLDSIDDLKKLVTIAAKLKEGGFLIDPNAALKEESKRRESKKILSSIALALAKTPPPNSSPTP